ncbi:MAG: esterase family protein [Anaerolineaceae bacterium]|nr:esterase family protein [Anaerolineaceae bacterium]
MNDPGPQISQIVQTIEQVSTQWTSISETETPTSTAVVTIIPSHTPILQSTETVVACNQYYGTLEYREFYTELLSFPFGIRVYLPPCYDALPAKHYPVLILLHTKSYNDDQWDRLGADEIADKLISTGEAPPFIIVMPRESNDVEDDKVSTYGSALIEALIPWIDEEYRTCTIRECRAIGGISRGGAWAMRMGLMNWELFGSIGAHSLAPFPGDFYESPYWFKKIPEGEWPRIYLDMGTIDDLMYIAGLFEDRLTNYGVPHEWIINTGTHNEDYWGAHVEDYLRWYTFPWKELFKGSDLEGDTSFEIPSPTTEISE